MWPYDYLNQFSNIELDNEFEKIYKMKKVFVAMRLKNTKKVYEYIKKAVDGEYRKLGVIICDRHSKKNISQRTKYRLKAIRADEVKGDNILINILGKIIESTLVICDITPKKIDDEYEFNANVILELGIAMAWKMPEQVIILLNKDNTIPKEKLPVDLRNYNIEDIDSKYKKLKNIVKNRIGLFKLEKNLILKNIKSKLDENSLKVLARQNGLMFIDEAKDAHTIRHLLSLGVIRTEVFPSPKITFGYCLTEIGKMVLSEIGQKNKMSEIKLYPDMLIDLYSVRYWAGGTKKYGCPNNYFNNKKEEFKKTYGITFYKCLDIFIDCIPDYSKKSLIVKHNLQKHKTIEKNLEIFNKYLEENSYDFIQKHTLSKWQNKIEKTTSRH